MTNFNTTTDGKEDCDVVQAVVPDSVTPDGDGTETLASSLDEPREKSAPRRENKPRLLYVRLDDQNGYVEDLWAADLGPAKGAPPGSRRVRLVNVTCFYSRPTLGDVIVVSPNEDGFPTWDEHTGILKRGGRYTMRVDFVPDDLSARGVAVAFRALKRLCEGERIDLTTADIVCERGPTTDEPGRAYLAVVGSLAPAAVMKRLREAQLPCEVIQVDPLKRRRRKNRRRPRRTR